MARSATNAPMRSLSAHEKTDHCRFALPVDDAGSMTRMGAASMLSCASQPTRPRSPSIAATLIPGGRRGCRAIRACVSVAAKRAAVLRDDGSLTNPDSVNHPKEVAGALLAALEIWLDSERFTEELTPCSSGFPPHDEHGCAGERRLQVRELLRGLAVQFRTL